MTLEEQELQQRVQVFVRKFGLLDKNSTPCGQPLPPSQAHALQVLGQGEGLTQQMLAGHLNLDKSTTSRLVTQVIERGWVTKTVNPENRREARLTLTDQGRNMLTQISTAAGSKYKNLWDRIPPQQRDQVLESLSLLIKALGEK